jgi:ubiquinone biosynthesis protein
METQPQLLLLQKTMVVAEGVGRALNPKLNMWQLAQPLIEAWMAENLGPQAQLRTAVEDGLETARRFSHLLERAERSLEVVADGGIRLHPTSLAALSGRRSKNRGGVLPWVLCLILAGIVLALLLE